MGKFKETYTRGGVGKSGMLENKSGNRPSLKRVKIEEKVTINGL